MMVCLHSLFSLPSFTKDKIKICATVVVIVFKMKTLMKTFAQLQLSPNIQKKLFSLQHWKRLKDFLRDESVVAGDGEGEAHKLPVRLLLLLVGVVRDLEAGRVVRTCRHPAHTHHQNSVRITYIESVHCQKSVV